MQTETLDTMRGQGMTISFLSNMTESMLQQGLHHAIERYFDKVISTDKKQTYKPDPTAYQLGVEMLGFKKEEILFMPFAGRNMAVSNFLG